MGDVAFGAGKYSKLGFVLHLTTANTLITKQVKLNSQIWIKYSSCLVNTQNTNIAISFNVIEFVQSQIDIVRAIFAIRMSAKRTPNSWIWHSLINCYIRIWIQIWLSARFGNSCKYVNVYIGMPATNTSNQTNIHTNTTIIDNINLSQLLASITNACFYSNNATKTYQNPKIWRAPYNVGVMKTIEFTAFEYKNRNSD